MNFLRKFKIPQVIGSCFSWCSWVTLTPTFACTFWPEWPLLLGIPNHFCKPPADTEGPNPGPDVRLEEGQPWACGFSFPKRRQKFLNFPLPGNCSHSRRRLATNAWTPILAQRRGFHAFPVEIAKNASANYRALPGQVHF